MDKDYVLTYSEKKARVLRRRQNFVKFKHLDSTFAGKVRNLISTPPNLFTLLTYFQVTVKTENLITESFQSKLILKI